MMTIWNKIRVIFLFYLFFVSKYVPYYEIRNTKFGKFKYIFRRQLFDFMNSNLSKKIFLKKMNIFSTSYIKNIIPLYS
jgi:hypothetical protein